MKVKFKKCTIKAISVLLIISVYLILYIGQVYNMSIQNVNMRAVIIIILSIFVIINIFIYLHRLMYNKLIQAFALYLTVVLIEVILHKPTSFSSIVNEVYFPIIYFSSYFALYRVVDNKSRDLVIKHYLLLLAVFEGMFFYATLILKRKNGLYINSCYYTSLLLPFVLVNKNDKIRLLGIILCVIPALLTGKRGAFLAIMIGWIVYLLAKRRLENYRINFSRLIKWIIGLLFVSGTVLYVANKFDSSLFDRLLNLFVDGGSGRVGLSQTMIAKLAQNNLRAHLIGHGTYTSSAIIGLSAHNDFLEMYWSYGLLGFIPYILIYQRLFRCAHILKQYQANEYPTFLASIIIFLMCSIYSQMIFVPSYSGLICIFWAFCSSKMDHLKEGVSSND